MTENLLNFMVRRYQRIIFFLFLIVFSLFFLMRAAQHKVLLSGNQSYELLSLFSIPQTSLSWIWIIPPLLGGCSILFLCRLALRFHFSKKSIFFFCLFLLITPAFTFSFTAFTFQGILLFLILLGMTLLLQEKRILLWCAVLPLLATTFIDGVSVLLSIAFLFPFLKSAHPKKNSNRTDFIAKAIVFLLVLSSIIQIFFLHQPFFRGPFEQENLLENVIVDFGNGTGMSIFFILLACVGLFASWKKEKTRWTYLYAGITLFAALFVQRNVLFLAVVGAFFAMQGFLFFAERKWAISFVKGFTLWVIILGMVLSFLASLPQQAAAEPSWTEVGIFELMRKELPISATVFSAPEQSYELKYFAGKNPFVWFHQRDQQKESDSRTIMESSYISTTFPLLEKRGLSFLYITPALKESLQEAGIVFVVKNERFRLRHSQHGYEVWEFLPEKENLSGRQEPRESK